MSTNLINSRLHQRAKAAAWSRIRAAAFLFVAVLASSAFSAPAPAAVVAPAKLHGAGASLISDELVTIDDVLAEVGASLEWAPAAGMVSGTTARDNHRKNDSPGEPTDMPAGGPENAQQFNYALLPVSSSSSTTSAGGTGSGGGASSMVALSWAAVAHFSVDCMITRLVLADQQFPLCPPLCGIFHPPRAFSSATLCA